MIFRCAKPIVILLAFASGLLLRAQSGAALPLTDSLLDGMSMQIRATAESDEMTGGAKERRIASIVRTTVAKTTGTSTDSAAALDTAVRLTETAVRVAPEFAEAIADAVALAPAVARVETGPSQIRASARAAAAEPAAPSAQAPQSPSMAVRPAKKRQASNYSGEAAGTRMNKQEAVSNSRSVANADDPHADEGPDLADLRLGENTLFDLALQVGVAHDDNIFLTPENEEDETIFRLSPGFSARFGRDAMFTGALSYQHSFVSYAGDSVPSVSLGSGSARFGLNRARIGVVGTMTYQQLYQNTRETVGLNEPFIRRNIFGLTLTAEASLTAKTSLGSGITFNSTAYKNDDLVDNHDTEIPLKFYFALTPKTSLSVGTSYRYVKAKSAIAEGSTRDLYHNLGIRGTLLPKLTGNLSVGYRTRNTDTGPTDKLLGFDGSLDLALTPKSSLSLLLNRDFGVGPLGEALQNARYTLRFSASPTDQWLLGASISHFDVQYGGVRSDDYLEAGLSTSYLFTSWFTASAEYTLRRNNSTAAAVEFSNNVLNLNLGFTY